MLNKLPICILIFLFITSVHSANLVTNPNFDKIDQGKVKGWQDWSWAPVGEKPMVTTTVEPQKGRNKSTALRIQVNKERHVGVWCNTPARINTDTGESYILKVWLKVEEGKSPQCKLSAGFTNKNWEKNNKNSVSKRFTLYPENHWQLLTLPINVPANDTYLRIDISLISPGAILINSISLTPAADEASIPGTPFAKVAQCRTAPVIDGKLDDACWKDNIELTNFLLTAHKGFPKAQTSVWITYNDSHLYFAFKCQEKFLDPKYNQMHRFKANCTKHDGAVWHDDCIEIFFTPHNSKTSYQLIANTRGIIYDTILKNKKGAASWTSNAITKASLQKDSWTIELAIPLSSLGLKNVNLLEQNWRMNVCRTRQPLREFSSWSPVPRGFHNPNYYGYISFTENVPGISVSHLKLLNKTRLSLKAQAFNSSVNAINLQLTNNIKADRKLELTTTEDAVITRNGKQDYTFIANAAPGTPEGTNARYSDYSYSFKQNGSCVYQSPVYRFKVGNASYLLASTLGRLISHSSKVQDLKKLFVVEGTAEMLTLLLTSARKDKLPETINFYLDMPSYCTLIEPDNSRDGILPHAFSCKTINRDGEVYRRYCLTFSRDAVVKSDNLEWDILPIHLFIDVNGAPPAKQEAKIYFHTDITELKYKEKEQHIQLKVLPPLSLKKVSSKLPFIVWPWQPFYEVTQHGNNEEKTIFDKWQDAGFNTVAAELQLSDFAYRKLLHNNYGFSLMKMLPGLTGLAEFPGAAEYLKKYPEEAEKTLNDKSVNFVCIPDMLTGKSAFIKELAKTFTPIAQTYQLAHIDYECGIFGNRAPGYSNRNIAMFKKTLNIPESEIVSIKDLMGKYKQQWIDFRCSQNGDMLKLYRRYLKKANPECIFGAYSAYQAKPEKRGHYGVDWKSFGKHLDLIMCGYGRGDYQTTRKAIGPQKLFCGGEGIWEPNYKAELAKVRFFRRLADCGSFMMFYDGIVDGRIYKAVSEATAIAADFEEFFLPAKRADILVSGKFDSNNVSALVSPKGERLIFIFNESDKPQQVIIENKDLSGIWKAIDYTDKKVLSSIEKLSLAIPPYDIKLIYLCKNDKQNQVMPVPVALKPNNKSCSSYPVIAWSDSGRLKTWTLEIKQQTNDKVIYTADNIKDCVYQVPQKLPPGDYQWRVQAHNIITGAKSGWSKWSNFSIKNQRKTTHTSSLKPSNPSIEKLGIWMPMKWGSSIVKDASALTKDYKTTRSGTYSLRIIKPITRDVPYWTNYRLAPTGTRLIRVKPGEEYRFTLWVKNKGKQVASKATVSFFDENKVRLPGKSAVLRGEHDWSKLLVTALAPPGAARLSLVLSSTAGPGTSWFDSFELKKMTGDK